MEILKLKIKIKTNTVFRLRRIKKIPFKIELRTPHAQPMLLPLSPKCKIMTQTHTETAELGNKLEEALPPAVEPMTFSHSGLQSLP